MISVLIVDDSAVVRQLLSMVLGSDPEIQVLGAVCDGEEAVEFVRRQKPDVITMDVFMPRMNGLEATRAIMEETPVPIVIVSANWNSDEVDKTFSAMKAGAVAVVEKPRGIGSPDFEQVAAQFVETIKQMAGTKPVRRRSYARVWHDNMTPPPDAPCSEIRVLAIGAATGGPPAIQTILSMLPRALPLPVMVVQQITPGFLPGLVEWIHQTTGFPVHIAEDGQQPLVGHVYLAPDNSHMGIDSNGRILLSKDWPENGLRPAVSYLFRTIARVHGCNAIGVLLTGMGRDGAMELKEMKDQGAVTVAQDEESCVVYGMSREAIGVGGATYVLPPEKVAGTICSVLGIPEEAYHAG